MGFKREIMIMWRDFPGSHAHIHKHFLILAIILCSPVTPGCKFHLGDEAKPLNKNS